ncbi:hypothetical protein niasHT_007048 [Heterodera trifolii]|uniref:CYtochrome P450 family n=1 Tax=Heterodera trifolii TaxID=157864 RepID=A0ABD2LZF7_9BILA
MFVFPIFVLCFSFLLAFYNFYYKRRKLPPGPIPLPLVGNILTLIRKKPGEDAFLEWKRKYGPIYTYWLGEMPVVCVADYENIVEVFRKGGEEFTQRQIFVDFTHEFRGNIYGIFFINGDFWKEQRKFASTVFRNFGLYSNLMEKKILVELSRMFERIDGKLAKSKSGEINLIEDVEISIGSIINCTLFGYGYDTEERIDEFHELLKLFDNAFKLAYEKNLGSLFSTLIVCFPNSTKNLPFFRERYEALMEVSRNLRNFFMKRIQKRAEQIDFKSDEYDDFVEAFLKEKERLDGQGIAHSFSMDQLWNICMDIWIAGQETSSTIIAWGMAHLLNNPQSLARVYDELDRVMGDERRLITAGDKARMPYTNATINEFLRISNMIVQNAYRRVFVDVTIGNFQIPKGTCILPQISVVLADDEVFDNPKMFRPERFLDENGNFVTCEKLIPFSVGRRKCFAESMAKMEIFLFTANILNQYRLSVGKVLPSIKREMGITIHCPKFECRVEKRIGHKL